MIRLFILILILFNSTKAISQTITFDSAVRSLYFGVDVFNASTSLLDTFSKLPYLEHNDTVVSQWNLNTSILMNTKEKAWSSSHVFSFTRSPIADLKIHSGKIVVKVGETSMVKKIISVNWQVDFETKSDGESFYNKLKEIFTPISTQQKIEYDENSGYIAQYSTRNEKGEGVKDVSFFYGKSLGTERYRIMLFLFNEFAADDARHEK